MDRKSILILIACFGLMLTWNRLMQKMYPTSPATASQTARATNSPANTASARASAAGTNPAANVSSPSLTHKFVVPTNVPEELIVLTNDDARFTFTSHGGGLKDVELLHYPETIATRRNKGRSA